MTNGVVLRALDGSNPLAFLAALGVFRLLALETQQAVEMMWERKDGFWRPKLHGIDGNEEALCEMLYRASHWAPAKTFIEALKYFDKDKDKVGNINVPGKTFKKLVRESCISARPNNRVDADFVAAFGCEVCEQRDKDRIEYTKLCFITGSGKQFFLLAMDKLEKKVTFDHLYQALFDGWRQEKAEGMSMRWDPSDAVEYALQWDDPEPIGARAVLGANRLAIEALPLFPTAPVADELQTTGFKYRNREDEFTWPIWEHYIGLPSVRSLMSLEMLQEDNVDRKALHAMGIRDVYRAQRVRIGQGANFKVNFRPARTI